MGGTAFTSGLPRWRSSSPPESATPMSVAFDLGFIGGFTPLIIQAIGLWLKNPLAGVILYTYVVAAVALITALLLLPETKDKALD